MMNGLQMLDGVDERLRQVENEARAAQDELNWLVARRDHARSEEAAALRALAHIRLKVLDESSSDLSRLDEADIKAQEILTKRHKSIAAAQADLESARPALVAAQLERDRCAAALHAVEADAQQALSKAREAVLADPAWQAERTAAEAALRVAEHADQKAAFALQDSEVKGRPYLADPLFRYLWNRKFGTSQYRAGFFVKLLDRWVARVARFEPARRDYTMLTDLPRQLAGHATRMREAADAAGARVSDRARQIAGLPAAQEVAALRQALDEAETRLEAVETDVQGVKSRLTAAMAGDDDLTKEAIGALEAALGQSSLQSLRSAAARTPTAEDDAIVASLEQASAVRAEADQLMAARRASVEAAQQQVLQLRQVRQEMRQRGYGQSRWNFGDSAMVGLLLGELLRGTVSRGNFWDRFNQQRLPDPWNQDPWGTNARTTIQGRQGAWSLPPRHDPWGQLGEGAMSGGFGGGGFSTGGQMGGGGFKTGGSF